MTIQTIPKKKRILLHVGLHKTASTYIQKSLAQSLQSLRKQGWNYPIYSDGKRKGMTNHSNLLYTLYSEEISSYVPNLQSRVTNQELFKRYKKVLDRELQSDFNLILSGEDVSSLSKASLHKLAKELEPYNVTVIAFVRETYSHLCSSLQHRIHRGVHGLTLEVPNLSHNCSRLKEVFPDIRFYSYERVKQQNNGFIKIFSKHCKISIKTANSNLLANESLGNKTIRFLAEFNLYYPLINSDKKLNPKRPSFIAKKLDFDLNKFLLTKQEYTTIERQIKLENRRLSSCTGLQVRTISPIPLADESDLTWNEAMGLLIKTSTMPTILAYRALIYVLQQKSGLKIYRIIRPCVYFLLFNYKTTIHIKNLFEDSRNFRKKIFGARNQKF